MKKENKYIVDNIQEAFCFGQLPQGEAAKNAVSVTKDYRLHERIKNIEDTLIISCSITPKENTKTSLFTLIDNAENTEIDLNNTPMISRMSDASDWNKAVENLSPLHHEHHLSICPVRVDDKVELYVAWLNDVLEESGHPADEFEESFLKLEGNCECTIDGKIYYLQEGDFLTIPPDVRHIIRNTSSKGVPVKGILQRKLRV